MWWGGRGQSFNIAPQKEEPEMGVRRRNLGGCRQEGENGDEVEIKGGSKGSRGGGGGCVCLSASADGAWSVFLSLKFVVSLSINQPLPLLSTSPGRSGAPHRH